MILENALDAILTIDAEQHIVLFNRAAEKMFRCTAKEAIGQSLNRFIPVRFRPAHGPHIRRFGQTGVTNRTMGAMGQLWALRTDGVEFPIEASISQTEAGGRKLFTVILRDITERKQAEARNLLLATIVDSSDDAIVSKDLSGTILSWNRGAERIYGYAEAEILGKSVDLIVPPDRLEETNHSLREVADGRMVTRDETTRVRKDGSLLKVSLILSPMRNAEGQIIGVSSIAHDITERKQAEEALTASQAQLTGIIQSATDAILTVDAQQRILLFNTAAEKMFGCPAAEAVGQLIERFRLCWTTLPVYSLAKLLTPVIIHEGRLRDSLVLLRIDLTPFSNLARGNWRETCRECFELLRRCVYIDKDLVLPAVGSNGPKEICYVVASTDMERVNIMISRVAEQLGALPHLKSTGTIHAEAKPIVLAFTGKEKSLEQQVQSVADKVTEMIVADIAGEQEFLGREKQKDASRTK